MNWYLKEVEADIETIEELAEKKVLVEKVIDYGTPFWTKMRR